MLDWNFSYLFEFFSFLLNYRLSLNIPLYLLNAVDGLYSRLSLNIPLYLFNAVDGGIVVL